MIPSFDAGSTPDEEGRAFQQDRMAFFGKVGAFFFLSSELGGRSACTVRLDATWHVAWADRWRAYCSSGSTAGTDTIDRPARAARAAGGMS